MIDLYDRIHEFFNSQQRFSFPYDRKLITSLTDKNGLYVLFERGETYNGLDRIVRIGSHRGKDRLVKRLKNHFLASKQRNSIFRKHIGRCYLTIEKDEYIDYWNKPFKKIIDKERYKDVVDLEYEKKYERLVTSYITENLSFALIPKIYDRNKRDEIEEGLIASLAQSSKRTATENWLGNYHPDQKIKNAKIWNIQHLNGQPLNEEKFIKLKSEILTCANAN